MNFQSLDFRRRLGPGLTGEPPVAATTAHQARPFAAVMGAIAILAGLYYMFIASPMYVSSAQFTVHNQQPAAVGGLLAGLMGSGANLADLQAVQEYIQSPEMLDALDKKFALREAYSQPRIDLLHWLRPNASHEALLGFYKKMVTVKLDREASIIEVDVKSFDKTSGTLIAQTILDRTENFVDGMTQRIRNETMQGAQSELNRAEADAAAARAAVANFRGASAAIDPAAAGAAVQGGQGALDTAAAAVQADLAQALSFNRPDSPTVMQLRARLASIESQANRLKAQQGGANLPRQVTNYETLAAARVSAEQKLGVAHTAYEASRVMAQQREKYVVRIVNPDTPDQPTEPRRFRDFLMVMIFALAGYAIISLTIAGIRDHQGI